MWYEIIPFGAIVMILPGIPAVIRYWSNILLIDNQYQRSFRFHFDRVCYRRDVTLGDSPYKMIGKF